MDSEKIKIFYKERQLMIVAQIIDQQEDLCSAKIIQDYRSPETKKLFNEFSDLVSNQVFSLLDEIETDHT